MDESSNRHDSSWSAVDAAMRTAQFKLTRQFMEQTGEKKKTIKEAQQDVRGIDILIHAVASLTELPKSVVTTLLSTKKGRVDVVKFVNYVYDLYDLYVSYPNSEIIDASIVTQKGFLVGMDDSYRNTFTGDEKLIRNADKSAARDEVEAFLSGESTDLPWILEKLNVLGRQKRT